MAIFWGVIIGVIVLTILVATHELGHAIVARRYGTKVQEFGIGFPPKIWSIRPKKSFLGRDVRFSINALPLGGFVKLQGEHDGDTEPGDFGRMTYWQKTQVLLAGIIINWLTAIVLITILAWVGLPKLIPNQFSVASDTENITKNVQLVQLEKGLPSDKAGLKPGDQLESVNGVKIASAEQLTEYIKQHAGQTVEVDYTRDGEARTAALNLRADNNDGKGIMGAGLGQQELMRATWSAPIVGVGTTVQMTGITIKGVAEVMWKGLTGLAMKLVPSDAVQNQANKQLATVSQSMAGPVGIFGVLFPAAGQAGVVYVLMIAAVISLTLAVMNILPIPALDGGRWFVMTLYRLRKKALARETEEKIHGIGFAVLMVLIILITISDIGKFTH